MPTCLAEKWKCTSRGSELCINRKAGKWKSAKLSIRTWSQWSSPAKAAARARERKWPKASIETKAKSFSSRTLSTTIKWSIYVQSTLRLNRLLVFLIKWGFEKLAAVVAMEMRCRFDSWRIPNILQLQFSATPTCLVISTLILYFFISCSACHSLIFNSVFLCLNQTISTKLELSVSRGDLQNLLFTLKLLEW